jgi:uncharacterized membrane protein YkvA (DUF1232 family)
MSSYFERLKRWARCLKRDLYVLYLAYRDARAPWYARLLAACVVAYAFSPIDLIPDFVPLLGYLDDLVLLPLGIALALRLLPPALLAECRARAEHQLRDKPRSWAGAAGIVALWLVMGSLGCWWLWRLWR